MRKKQSDLGHFSDPSLLILSSLVSGPKHGCTMMTDIYEFTRTRMEPGTLYGAISRLEECGWIQPLLTEDRPRPYRITTAGLAALGEQLRAWKRVVSKGLQRLSTI